MTQQSNLPLLELLYEALRAEIGVSVATEDVGKLRQKLYALRREDPSLRCLSLVPSPVNPNGELWILKKGTDNAGE